MKLWIERFSAALAVLATEVPPADLVKRWVEHDESANLTLQDWARDATRLPWLQGIALIDAAEHMADNPAEGEDFDQRPRQLESAR